MGITRAAIIATTAVIRIRVTEHLTIMVGRITTEAIELTSIISIVTTAIRRRLMKVKGWLGVIPSQLFLPQADHLPAKA
jgi:hypothetical protein